MGKGAFLNAGDLIYLEDAGMRGVAEVGILIRRLSICESANFEKDFEPEDNYYCWEIYWVGANKPVWDYLEMEDNILTAIRMGEVLLYKHEKEEGHEERNLD
jgi:hypothetical protein